MSFLSISLYSFLFYQFSLRASVSALVSSRAPENPATAAVDIAWYPPNATWITDLQAVVNGSGLHGFIFNNSYPQNVQYGEYNWCNMPHVRTSEYITPSAEYELEYVELIHRHHKRTPYAANNFPQESSSWDCSDGGLFYYGQPLSPTSKFAASTYWNVYSSPINPFAPSGFNGTCQFPQISRGGLEDSWQHGKDLFGVYHDRLHFLPDEPDNTTSWRVTNNVITSQVAGMVVNAMYPDSKGPFPLLIQPASIDSLEPAYPCPVATAMYANYSVGSKSPAWITHLNASSTLFESLDAISGVARDDTGFHRSWDHYYDNLSARQCHDKPLPCSITSSGLCVGQDQANEVYRLGQWEYSYIHRGANDSLRTATAAYGVWIAELAYNIRGKVSGTNLMKYRHNIAHDGSVSRLLSVLQLDVMVWPGMGSEVVFEVYKRQYSGSQWRWFVRVLWGGKVLRSSNPSLGLLDMVDLDVLLGYFDALGTKKVVDLCRAT